MAGFFAANLLIFDRQVGTAESGRIKNGTVYDCFQFCLRNHLRVNIRSHSVISGRALRRGRAPTAEVDARSTSV